MFYYMELTILWIEINGFTESQDYHLLDYIGQVCLPPMIKKKSMQPYLQKIKSIC